MEEEDDDDEKKGEEECWIKYYRRKGNLWTLQDKRWILEMDGSQECEIIAEPVEVTRGFRTYYR